MNMPSLYEFERKLFEVGYNKDGLVIDVRGNGGGSTADRLLTALTQPRHAITVPRGGGPGYPQDRMVYATWDKPVVVLCNQNSFSNAEIFSHAIRVLKRGRLVGVQTAGGVISTGATTVMDLGTLRQPFRGWFSIETGEDMELNGAMPHVQLWPLPGEMPQGIDQVLERSVKVLTKDVDRYLKRPSPKLIKATQRPENGATIEPEKQ
jgi:tricorn protease